MSDSISHWIQPHYFPDKKTKPRVNQFIHSIWQIFLEHLLGTWQYSEYDKQDSWGPCPHRDCKWINEWTDNKEDSSTVRYRVPVFRMRFPLERGGIGQRQLHFLTNTSSLYPLHTCWRYWFKWICNIKSQSFSEIIWGWRIWSCLQSLWNTHLVPSRDESPEPMPSQK